MTEAATEVERINSFALVTYIPDPLGSFLDDLRCELVPNCIPRAHVTILPPRPLSVSPQHAWPQACSHIRESAPFVIEPTEVEIFDSTSVIYIALGAGHRELRQMHDRLNTDKLAFDEPFPYHPHITLAQELDPGHVMEVYELARRRWAEFPHQRSFLVETMTFVQNTIQNQWVDLAHCTLGAVPLLR